MPLTLRTYILYLLLIVVFCAKAQKGSWYLVDSILPAEINADDKPILDSVLKLYHASKQDTTQLNALLFLAENLSEPKLWLSYNALLLKKTEMFMESKADLSKLDTFYLTKKAYALNNIGYYFQNILHKDKESIYYFDNAIAIFERLNNLEGLGTLYQNIAVSFKHLNQLKIAIDYYNKSYQIACKINNFSIITYLLINMAETQNQFGEYDLALKNIRKGINLVKNKTTNTIEYFTLLIKASNAFLLQKKWDSAVYYSNQAIKALGNSQYRYSYTPYANIGNAYSKQNKFDSANYFLNIAFAKVKSTGDSTNMAGLIEEIAWNNYRMGNYSAVVKKIEPHLKWLIKKSEHYHAGSFHEVLARSYGKLGKHKEANDHWQLYNTDRLYFYNDENKALAMRQEYEMDFSLKSVKQEQENEKNRFALNYEKRIKKIVLLSAICIVLVVGILLLVVYNRYRKIKLQKQLISTQNARLEEERGIVKEKNKIIQSKNDELTEAIKNNDELRNINTIFQLKAQLLRNQMNPHFIFNSLNSIQKFILQKETEQSYIYITKFSKLIRKILDNSDKVYNYLSDELELINLYIELEQVRFNNRFDYKLTIEESLDTDNLLMPTLFIQPYVENAIWHGIMNLEEQVKGFLQINIYSNNNHLVIEVIDNGIGIAASHKLKSSSHTSRSNEINAKRVDIMNTLLVNEKAVILIEDAAPSGTKVLLKFPHRYE